MNKPEVRFTGHLIRDPEFFEKTTTTSEGAVRHFSMIKFTVCVTTGRDRLTGKSLANFFDVKAEDELCEKYRTQLNKGSVVTVAGTQIIKGEMNEDGVQKYRVKVTASDIEIMPRNEGEADAE